MKKISFLVTICILCTTNIFSQSVDEKKERSVKSKMVVRNPKISINLSSGIDNPVGIFGVGFNYYTNKNILIGVGVGTSTWGTKFSVKGMYFTKPNFLGSAFGLALNQSAGFELDNATAIQTNNSFYGRGGSVTSVNLMYARYWKLGAKSRFYIQTGIASKLNNPNMTFFYLNSNQIISSSSVDYKLIKILSPGGLVGNIGFDIVLK
jgi:hypothetical protein